MTKEADHFGRQTIATTIGPAINRFTNNFLKVVVADGNHENLITSPLSAHVVLAMAAYGAGGTTATQMRSVLLISSDEIIGQFAYQSLIKSFDGEQLGSIIILPNEVNGLKTVLDNLYLLNLRESLQQVWPSEIELFLPKFRIKNTLELGETLKKLGVTEMFTEQANFSGISEIQLKVNNVVQKAFIDVKKKGSEAAAATSLGYVGMCCEEP